MNLAIPLIAALSTMKCSAQDFIFPDEATQRTTQITTFTETTTVGRIPVLIPGRCPPNQILYPVGQNDWVCDCGSGYIYYPPKDGCFKAYRQGPCDKNKYLMLAENEVASQCIQNPCSTDGFVRFEGKCYHLDKPGKPCGPTKDDGGIFGVNSTTLELQCLKGGDALSLINFPANCPKGTKRGANHCRQPY